MKKVLPFILMNTCLVSSIMGAEFDFNILPGPARDYFLYYRNKSTPDSIAGVIQSFYKVSVPKTTAVGLKLSNYISNISESYITKQSVLKLLNALDGRGDNDILEAGIRKSGPEKSEIDPIKHTLYTVAASSLIAEELFEEYNKALASQPLAQNKYHVHMVYYLILKVREFLGHGNQSNNVEVLFKNSWDYKRSEWFKFVQKFYDEFARDTFEAAKTRFLDEVRLLGKDLPQDYHVDFDTIEAYRLAKNSRLFQSLVNNPVAIEQDAYGSTWWYNSLRESDKIPPFTSAIAIFSSFVREGNQAFWQYIRNEDQFLHDFTKDSGIKEEDVQLVVNQPEIKAPENLPLGWYNWDVNSMLVWVDQQYEAFAKSQNLPYQAWPRNQQIYFRTIVSMAKEALKRPTTFEPTSGQTKDFKAPASVPQQYRPLWLKTQQDFLQRQGWIQAVLEVIHAYVYAKENNILNNFYNQITNQSGPCSPAKLRAITEWADTQKKFRSFNGLKNYEEISQVAKAYEHIIQTTFLQKSQNNSVELPTLISWLSPFMIHYVAFYWRYNLLESPISISGQLAKDDTSSILMAKDKHNQFVFDKIFTQEVYINAIKDLIERTFVYAIGVSANDKNIFDIVYYNPLTYRSKLPIFHGHKAKFLNQEFSEVYPVLYQDGNRLNRIGGRNIPEFNTLNNVHIEIIMELDGKKVDVMRTIKANKLIFDYISYALTSSMQKSLAEVRQQLSAKGIKSKIVN